MTDTNQKLREALLSDMDIAVLRMPVHMAFAGDMAQFQYHNRVQSLLNRIEALAMQPDVPETNFGKLREALQVAEAALSDIGDADREPGDDLAWCERRAAQNLPLIRQALALPTADHIPDAGEMVVDHLPDAGKMIETAAPDMPLSMNQFGRLVELTREHLTDNTFVYKATSKAGDTCHFGVESAAKAWAKGGTVEAIKVREFKLHTSSPTAAPVGEREAFGYFYIVNGVHEGFCKGVEPPPDDSYDEGTLVPVYRSALSAGDAVDAQRLDFIEKSARCDPKMDGQHVWWPTSLNKALKGPTLRDAIDAAMRKGQL